MRKVFLDIGAHGGQSVCQFYDEIEDAADWRIYCFEPLPTKSLKDLPALYENVSVIENAIALHHGSLIIYPVPNQGQGATMVAGKLTGSVDYANPRYVAGLNIVHWFERNICEDDFVVVKVNIEGGEYSLMRRLPEILPKIAAIHIKLHHGKFGPDVKEDLLAAYEAFRAMAVESDAFVYCDPTEEPYRFKWLVEQAYAKRQ